MVNYNSLNPRQREELLNEIEQLNTRIRSCQENRKSIINDSNAKETWLIQERIYHEMRIFLKEIIIKNKF